MSKDMKNDIERVFFTEEEIEAKVKELGEQISKDFEGKDPLFVGVLKGCFVFMSDLMRHVTVSGLSVALMPGMFVAINFASG